MIVFRRNDDEPVGFANGITPLGEHIFKTLAVIILRKIENQRRRTVVF